ncbi:MAG: UvrD-helicase domain-containing protein [Sphingobacteriaceae bacterium]|nr:UvrD-helicase domain-containing protein [Sphingobacteriaceae bacterium]
MDKRVIFAVAGSGKTTHIVDKLNLESPVIIVTYTNSNVENLRERILKKFGYFPSNIKLQSYFSFLHRFCYKPFLFRNA